MVHYKYIEIGTSDFATLINKYPNDIGLSVEPIKSLLDNLPDKKNNTKVNYAISDKTGTAEFYKLKDEFLEDKEHRQYERGMSSLVGASNEEKRITKSVRFERFEKINVPTKSLEDFFKEYDVESVEYLKLDTEGFDINIMNQLYRTNIRPKWIKFESCHSSEEEIKNILDCFSSYDVRRTKNDIYLNFINTKNNVINK